MSMKMSRDLMAIPIFVVMIILMLPKSLAQNNETSVPNSDVDLLEFPLNLEFLEAEFFLYGALGYGLDIVAPQLTKGGPAPIGATKANLDNLTADLILQFAWQEVGHLRFLTSHFFFIIIILLHT